VARFAGIMHLAQDGVLMGCGQVEGCDEGHGVWCVVFEVIFDLFDMGGRLQHEEVGEIRESLQWCSRQESCTWHKMVF
jgi:hypothetical protein